MAAELGRFRFEQSVAVMYGRKKKESGVDQGFHPASVDMLFVAYYFFIWIGALYPDTLLAEWALAISFRDFP